MNQLRLFTDRELARLSRSAAAAPRLRQNLNVHPVLEDPIQRLFNAMEPGTYVRPHRHARSAGWEFMLAVRGAFAVLLFDPCGIVLERADMIAGIEPAVEIPAFAWHAVVVLEPGTVMFEVKPGPYHPLDDKDFADWAPVEGDAAAPGFVAWYERAQPGEPPPDARAACDLG